MEIQYVICNIACWAVIRELADNAHRKRLISEIYLYHLVKADWGLGHVRVSRIDKFLLQRQPFNYYFSPLTCYVVLNGEYVDLEGRRGTMFLGNCYDQALRRMKHVKSFL